MGSDGGCRAEPCFKSSVTMSWETRQEPVRLGSAGIKLLGREVTLPAQLPMHTALCFPSLSFSHNFLLSVFRESTEKGPSGICSHSVLFYLPSPSHPHSCQEKDMVWRTCQIEQTLPSPFPCTGGIMCGERVLVNHQVTENTPPSVLFFLQQGFLKSARDKYAKWGINVFGIGKKQTAELQGNWCNRRGNHPDCEVSS